METYNQEKIEAMKSRPDFTIEQIKFEEDPRVRLRPGIEVSLGVCLINNSSPTAFELIIELHNPYNGKYKELKMQHCLPTSLFPDDVSGTIAALCGDNGYDLHGNMERLLVTQLIKSAHIDVDTFVDNLEELDNEITVEFSLSIKHFTTDSGPLALGDLDKFLEHI